METPREKREGFVLEWLRKKLNRDELLRVLGSIETLDEKRKEEMEQRTIRDFYKNYDKAKEKKKGYIEAEELYRGKGENMGIKYLKSYISRSKKDIQSRKNRLNNELDAEYIDIAQRVGKYFIMLENLEDLEKGGMMKRLKLNRLDKKWDKLIKRGEEVRGMIGELEEEEKKLEEMLKKKEAEYGVGKGRQEVKNEKILYRKMDEIRGDAFKGLKLYVERYNEILKEKEEYVEYILKEIDEIDFGISKEMKEEIKNVLIEGLNSELERMKQGNDMIQEAKKTEEWLMKNEGLIEKNSKERDKAMAKIKVRKQKIADEIAKLKGQGVDPERILELQQEQVELKRELEVLEAEYNGIEVEYNEKYKLYYGMTYEEMKEKEKEEKKKSMEWLYEFAGEIQEQKEGVVRDTMLVNGKRLGDRIGVVLVDYIYDSRVAGCEYGTKIFVKRGNNTVYKRFVYRDPCNGENDDWGKAYTSIVSAECKGDEVVVCVKSNSETSSYTFSIKES